MHLCTALLIQALNLSENKQQNKFTKKAVFVQKNKNFKFNGMYTHHSCLSMFMLK